MPTSELARREPRSTDAAFASRVSNSKLMPKHIANDPASAEYMMRIGEALGIDPVSAFQHIFVFPDSDGRLKAGMSAHLMQALALAAGHAVHVEGDALKATATLIRKTTLEDLHRFNVMQESERKQKQDLLDNLQRLYDIQRQGIRSQIEDLQLLADMGGDNLEEEIKELQQQLLGLRKEYDFEALRQQLSETNFDLAGMVHFKSEWTMARARQAGLVKEGGTWQKFGPDMLKARAKSSVVRDGAIDVILGIKSVLGDLGVQFSDEPEDDLAVAGALYTPEELGAEVDGDGVPLKGRIVDVTAPGASASQDKRLVGAKKLIAEKTAEEIQKAVLGVAQSGTAHEEKILRVNAVAKAVELAGRGDEPVQHGEENGPLSLFIENVLQALKQSSDSEA